MRLRFPVGREKYEWFNHSISNVRTDIYIPSIPLAQAIKWAWRVRKWTVAISGQMKICDPLNPTTAGTLYTFSSSSIFDARATFGVTPPANELGLMTAQIVTRTIGAEVAITTVPAPYTGSTSIDATGLDIDILGTGDPCKPDPVNPANVLANCSFLISPGDRWSIGTIPSTEFAGFGFTTGTMTIDGVSIPITAYSRSFVETSVTLIGFSWDISPSEYWPYADAAGGNPVYHLTTGAQLQGYGLPVG